MIINFNGLKEMTIPGMNNGTGQMTVRMYNDEKYRIIPTVIHAGGSIGLHMQSSGDDMNYPELFTPVPGNRLNTGKPLIKMKNRLSPKR